MKLNERLIVWLIDTLTINAAYLLYYKFRVESGMIEVVIRPEFWLPMIALWAFWSIAFFFFGLYREWYDQSRLDELFTLLRSTSVGVLILFFLIVIDDLATDSPTTSRMLILGYWVFVTVFVVTGRLVLRFIERRLLIAGVGVRNTLIIGWSKRAFDLCDMIMRSPALGYRVVGFVPAAGSQPRPGRKSRRTYRGFPILGGYSQLDRVIDQHRVKEILVGLDSRQHDQLLDVVGMCEGRNVRVKILADLYDIVTGQSRIHSIFGLPLLDVQPEIMRPWEEAAKRSLDAAVSVIILIAGLPLWCLIAIFLRMDTPGPVFYRQERVGRNGRVFRILKFRSMFADAEKNSGPVWAGKNDPRVTSVGRVLRRYHLDEVPQFINVLIGDMSLVGPRPERPHFVEKLSKEIPLYLRRLKVRPGITGWAQVKHKYDESIEDVRTKVKYDLFYIENASWRFDLIILLNTLYVMIMRRGHT